MFAITWKKKQTGELNNKPRKVFLKKYGKPHVSPVLKRFVSNFPGGESKPWEVLCFETKLVFTAVLNLVLLPRVCYGRGWKLCLDLFLCGKVAEVTSREKPGCVKYRNDWIWALQVGTEFLFRYIAFFSLFSFRLLDFQQERDCLCYKHNNYLNL